MFPLHQRLYLSSLQNTLPIPSYEGDIEPVRYWWSPGIQVPYCLAEILGKEDSREGIIPLTLLLRDANFKNLLADLDPRSKKPAKFPANFPFFSTTHNQLPQAVPGSILATFRLAHARNAHQSESV
eukprot:Phypoly_transcript_20352.p1 GENE.Phypoly_transcript_20352~~Phypoly_transcript_20352.p1  ORF type:complete len:126 (+),score=12.11 Phypoly_transcript_20352:290-667(+)